MMSLRCWLLNQFKHHDPQNYGFCLFTSMSAYDHSWEMSLGNGINDLAKPFFLE